MKADQEAEPLENVEDATSKEKSPAGGGLKKTCPGGMQEQGPAGGYAAFVGGAF